MFINLGNRGSLFDELIDGSVALEVPLEGNGKSLCSLRIRISDALKWLADRFRAGDPTMEPYARLKSQLRFKAADSALHLQVRQPHAFRAIPHLDPALQARLSSALQRPDLKPQTRAKIEKILKPNESHPAGRHHPTCQPVSAPIRSSSETPCEIVDGF